MKVVIPPPIPENLPRPHVVILFVIDEQANPSLISYPHIVFLFVIDEQANPILSPIHILFSCL